MSAPFDQPGLFEASTPADRAGFRLRRLEVYNWGTFHERVWALQPDGDNALLTGDIGSGKSTLVDAITTLLIPPGRLAFNKAAGADARERSLRSYVLGYYKSERSGEGLAARPVPLRDHNAYTVLLAQFANEALKQTVTLAQVYWIQDARGGPPARLYVLADGELSIAQHFAGFGADILDLRKRLRTMPQVEISDDYPPYGAALRRRFGIESPSALDLFHQTVSLKSVGDLTHFVRDHMLEAFDVAERIRDLLAHFDDLQRAHAAVIKARDQIARLTPIIADCDHYAEGQDRITNLRGCRDALRPYFAGIKADLIDQRMEGLRREIARLQAREERLAEEINELERARERLKSDIAASGGTRIETLKAEIARHERERSDRQRRADQYDQRARELGLSTCSDEASFAANLAQVAALLQAAEDERATAQNEETQLGVELHQLRHEHAEQQRELDSLKRQRSNIPANMLGIRDQLCQVVGARPDDLPFVGELLRVRDDARAWEGAIERLLHGYGLSLLVSDAHYAAVSEWVNRTDLRGRLVYLRMRPTRGEPGGGGTDALWRKLDIKPDAPQADWLEASLADRFDHICCESLDRFRREHRAITLSGQIKGGAEHHEKDDRHRIDDRTRYVLGWTNQEKIAAFEAQMKRVAAKGLKVTAAAQRQMEARKAADQRVRHLEGLQIFNTYADLDWRTPALEIQRKTEEIQALERTSDTLRTLSEQLAQTEERRLERRGQKDTVIGERGQAQAKLGIATDQRRECAKEIDAAPDATRARYPQLDQLVADARPSLVESCGPGESRLREQITTRIDNEEKASKRLGENITRAMQDYRNAFPLETQEVDARPQAAPEFRRMLDALRADDLPRFEASFKRLLNENTIREVANFQSQLYRERQLIHERVDAINRSLRDIDYNQGRYITLLAVPTQDKDIREFQQHIRACTEGALTGSDDDAYSEAKFVQVQELLERFKGREGRIEEDRRWTQKVTDVRGWFGFAASERWREDDREHEHYSDSGGKSGGQKEKLAYTVLAASLAYQFGLDEPRRKARSFRFALIDEAFGRGSDESARFGLELFARLHLQLLVVTPLQKIHIIEPYVASVGFVHNEEGRRSMIRSLTIEAYRAERAARSS